MSLRYTIARHGLLNNSYPIILGARDDCRTATYRNRLFCVFVDDVVPNRARYASRVAIGGWSGAIDVGCESHQGTPAIFTFQDKLYILASGRSTEDDEQNIAPILAIYDPSRDRFDHVPFRYGFHGTPSLIEYDRSLYIFYRTAPGAMLMWSCTQDMQHWSTTQPVFSDGVDPIMPTLDPVACVYQGLIHLFHDLPDGLGHIRFDGKSGWSRSRLFIEKAFRSPPGVVVHDGLLTLACTHPGGRDLDTTLYVYRYDGNALGLADMSIGVQAIGPAAASVMEGLLFILYRAPDRPHDSSGQGGAHAR